MSVYRVEKNGNSTIMSNRLLQDRRLSLKAKWLLSYMLSLPDDWDYSVRGLAVCCKEGADAIRHAIHELEANGYLRRTIDRNSGKISGQIYDIFEEPMIVGSEEAAENQHWTLLYWMNQHWIIQCWIFLRWKIQRRISRHNKVLKNKIRIDKILFIPTMTCTIKRV